MNARTTDYLVREKGADFDLQLEKSTEGIVVPTPVIFESEILGENRPVLYWYGDDERGQQREFPICVSPEFFDKELAADSKHCDVQFVGSLANLPGGRHGVGRYQVGCHRKDLEEKTQLVCGMISGMSFIFEIVSLALDNKTIRPMSYIKE